MTGDRWREIAAGYAGLRVGVVGDFFLDRYLEIDPTLGETSIETGLPVHNVVRVRSQPGAAGTIVNNLVALGIGTIPVVGFCGDDGEGYELRRALARLPGVALDHFCVAPDRRTPVYCKPLVVEPGRSPRELSRLDSKNWTPTPDAFRRDLAARVLDLAGSVDALILMDQVDAADTGAIGPEVARAAASALEARPAWVALADARRGLAGYPPLDFKMNGAELARMAGSPASTVADASRLVGELAARTGRAAFVTLAEGGIVAARGGSAPEHRPALPLRGPIDVVGAGDAVTANLAAALAAGATLGEALELAMLGASVAIHQLGTTGTASPRQIADLIAAIPPEGTTR